MTKARTLFRVLIRGALVVALVHASGCGKLQLTVDLDSSPLDAGSGQAGQTGTDADSASGKGEAGSSSRTAAPSDARTPGGQAGQEESDGQNAGGSSGHAGEGGNSGEAAEAGTSSGGQCGALPGTFSGCTSASPCAVCTDGLYTDYLVYDLYFDNHPHCEPTDVCDDTLSPCSSDCPAPQLTDSCDGADGGWLGCRGNGCYVCRELTDNFPKYFARHPNCIANGSCGDGGMGSLYFECSAACPEPTIQDR